MVSLKDSHRDARSQCNHHFDVYKSSTSSDDTVQPSRYTGEWAYVDVWTAVKNHFQLTQTASKAPFKEGG